MVSLSSSAAGAFNAAASALATVVLPAPGAPATIHVGAVAVPHATLLVTGDELWRIAASGIVLFLCGALLTRIAR
jgi:hypothetical protein